MNRVLAFRLHHEKKSILKCHRQYSIDTLECRQRLMLSKQFVNIHREKSKLLRPSVNKATLYVNVHVDVSRENETSIDIVEHQRSNCQSNRTSRTFTMQFVP
jgi:hypothetical protein